MDLKTLCALFMGGALGVGGTVVTQQAAPKPAISKPATGKKALQVRPDRPVVKRSLTPAAPPILFDCALPSASIGGLPIGSIPTASPRSPRPLLSGGYWDGDDGFPLWPSSPNIPPVTEVPEPASWAMLVAGFGLVGFAARKARA